MSDAQAAPGSGFDTSIVIPLFNKVEYTYKCLDTLARVTPGDRFEVILVDNASTDATGDLLDRLEGDVTIIRNAENLGFSKACNQGAAAACGRTLLFLNNDTVPHERWLEPLLDVLDREPDVGIVGSKLLFPDGSLQHAGVLVIRDPNPHGTPITPVHAFYRAPADLPIANIRRDMSAVTGACLLIRREAFDAVGGFDEEYWNGYEDMELCFSVGELGWRIVYEPASVLDHYESVSGPERFRKQQNNIDRLNTRWIDRMQPEARLVSHGMAKIHTPVATYTRPSKAGQPGGPPNAGRNAA